MQSLVDWLTGRQEHSDTCCSGLLQDTQICGFAGAITEGQDVIENPVKARRELVDISIIENVGFGDRHVAPVVLMF